MQITLNDVTRASDGSVIVLATCTIRGISRAVKGETERIAKAVNCVLGRVFWLDLMDPIGQRGDDQHPINGMEMFKENAIAMPVHFATIEAIDESGDTGTAQVSFTFLQNEWVFDEATQAVLGFR